jgi:hypothetical protein
VRKELGDLTGNMFSADFRRLGVDMPRGLSPQDAHVRAFLCPRHHTAMIRNAARDTVNFSGDAHDHGAVIHRNDTS